MKTAISIPDAVFQRAEVVARHLGVSRSELYARAVEAYVSSREDEAVTAALNEVYAEQESRIEPELARYQARVIGPEDW